MGLHPGHRLDVDLAREEWDTRKDPAGVISGTRSHLGCEEWKRDLGRWIPKASSFGRAVQDDPRVIPDKSTWTSMDPETARRIREARK